MSRGAASLQENDLRLSSFGRRSDLSPSQHEAGCDEEGADLLRGRQAREQAKVSAVIAAQELDGKPAETVQEQVTVNSMRGGNDMVQNQAECNQECQLVQLGGMYRYMAMGLTGGTVGRKLHG